MKREEKKLLFFSKLKEGKTELQAKKEVERDIIFLKNFKIQRKKLTEEIKRLEKKKLDLNKRFKREFEKLKMRKEKVKSYPPKRENKRVANTNHLDRVLNFLKSENKIVVQKKITEFCMLNGQQTKSALLFLVNKGLVKKDDGGYIINNANR